VDKNIKNKGWDVAWWYSACLACMRPWVRSQHKKTKYKKKKKKEYQKYKIKSLATILKDPHARHFRT
jgi:hypothetical protein